MRWKYLNEKRDIWWEAYSFKSIDQDVKCKYSKWFIKHQSLKENQGVLAKCAKGQDSQTESMSSEGVWVKKVIEIAAD